VRAEYLGVPGLCPTKEEAQRLWGLDAATVEALLAALVDVKCFRCTRQMASVRYTDG
jgi:hypothetical protein